MRVLSRSHKDEIIDLSDTPDHDGLCAIREDIDLTGHVNDAVNSLRIILAANESIRTGKTVENVVFWR